MEVAKIREVMKDLEKHIQEKQPFSLIRFGDGGIKYLHSVLYDDWRQLSIISKKEGIPLAKVLDIFELWGFYARHANYIDTPQVYFDEEFWPRLKKPPNKPMSKATVSKLKMWRELYNRAEFDNESYCNPEIHYLMILRISKKRKNLIDIMKRRKVCFITDRAEVFLKFREHCSMDIFSIVGQYENQYVNSYYETIDFIKRGAKDYDLWLVSAGELGRIYSGVIKEEGGRSVDIGFVVNFWMDGKIPIRLQPFIEPSPRSWMELRLSERGLPYRRFL